MGAYPSAKIHRPSRRRLGKGQAPNFGTIGTTVTNPSGNLTLITCTQPVIASGPVGLTVGNSTLVLQTQTTPTTIQQQWTGNISAATYNLPNNPANLIGRNGQGVAGTAGTF